MNLTLTTLLAGIFCIFLVLLVGIAVVVLIASNQE
jgi:hypothetical protein